MRSADQVPINIPHSIMRGGKWVVLIAGSTGSALRAVRPPNLHITLDAPARSHLRLRRQCDGFFVALALDHHRPDHSGNLVCERDGGNFGRPPRQQCCEPGPMFGAMDLGIANDGECTGHEQASQIAVALFADTAEPVLASARMLFRNEPDPSRKVTP